MKCAKVQCAEPRESRGWWCAGHRPHLGRPGAGAVGQTNGRWSEAPTYDAAHKRVRRNRGQASSQTCPCGDSASQWAYDKSDPAQLHEAGKGYYSANPERYVARCHPCHVEFDTKVKV